MTPNAMPRKANLRARSSKPRINPAMSDAFRRAGLARTEGAIVVPVDLV